MGQSSTPGDGVVAVPNGTERPRVFLPTKDFEVSKAFYAALGFNMILEGDVAIFPIGGGEVILTRLLQMEYAGNVRLQVLVDDIDAWWAHISLLDLPQHFGVPAPKEPSMQPWGLRIASVIDPCGVLWYFAERPDDGRVV
jgi:hypothetical protein